MSRNVVIGGPAVADHSLLQFWMVKSDDRHMSLYKAAVMDAVSLKPIEGATVDLHFASNNITALSTDSS